MSGLSPSIILLLRYMEYESLYFEGKYAHFRLFFLSVYFSQYRKTPQNSSFQFLWRINPIVAPFAKIRQIYTFSKGHQRPLNRAGFCHLFYPIRAPERLPEREYEGRFFLKR